MEIERHGYHSMCWVQEQIELGQEVSGKGISMALVVYMNF